MPPSRLFSLAVALGLLGCGSAATSSPDGASLPDAEPDASGVTAPDLAEDTPLPSDAAEAGMDLPAGTARLTTDRADVTFSAQLGCVAPQVATVRARNAGDGASGALAVTVTDPFVLGADGCSGRTLGPGQTCDVEVRFLPTSLVSKTGTLIIAANPGGQSTVALTGHSYIPEGPTFYPSSALDFSNIPVGASSAPQAVMLRNVGGAPSAPLEISVSSPEFVIVGDTCNHAILQPGQSCSVQVVFRPISVGGKQGVLTVETTDACGLARGRATLSGTGLPPPDAGAADVGP